MLVFSEVRPIVFNETCSQDSAYRIVAIVGFLQVHSRNVLLLHLHFDKVCKLIWAFTVNEYLYCLELLFKPNKNDVLYLCSYFYESMIDVHRIFIRFCLMELKKL